MLSNKTLYVIEGPTAVGKTDYAISKALECDAEIISADSRQFFKELNIGVARPSEEQLNTVKHHFIANISIHDYYSVSKFEIEALALLDKLFMEHNAVVLCGGSGLYVNALCNGIDDLPDPNPTIRQDVVDMLNNEGIEVLQNMLKILDPVFYDKIDLQNHKRLCRAVEVCLQTGKPYSDLRTNTKKERNFNIVRTALFRDKNELNERINKRVDIMLENGLLDEIKSVYQYKNLNALNTVGYKELFRYLDGEISLDQAVTDIKTNTRRYAKRQMTWLNKQPTTFIQL
ncbi:tRNA dimethylallyltransferase 1 [Bacteroidia bacterium]|nr:tRNA dimethylallyltransferase 1 [Bacteroidia bacterium]